MEMSMGTETAIAWTDHTFNPWIGCSKVHTGCTNCYAESYAKRYGKAEWGANGTRVLTSDANWKKPLKWNREAEAAGVRAKVFCASLADVFEDWQGPILNSDGREMRRRDCGSIVAGSDGCPKRDCDCDESWILTLADVRARLFALWDATPWLDWQVLTKRPENVRKMWCSHVNTDGRPPSMLPRSNVWLGTSVSSQVTADSGSIVKLIELRDLTPVLFVSAEPLIGSVDFTRIATGSWAYGKMDVLSGYLCGAEPDDADIECDGHIRGELGIDWLIVGGESGHGRRDCGVEAINSVARQCVAADVPVFVKQDCVANAGERGRIPDDVWALKQFPLIED
jgi:protein gp37